MRVGDYVAIRYADGRQSPVIGMIARINRTGIPTATIVEGQRVIGAIRLDRLVVTSQYHACGLTDDCHCYDHQDDLA